MRIQYAFAAIVSFLTFAFVTGIFNTAPAPFANEAQAAIERVPLKGHFWKKAKGDAVIRDLQPGQKEVTISAQGLKPDSTYTVWLVNEKPKSDMTGLGKGDYSFKTDSKGVGRYTATVPESEIGRWDLFEVAYHPDNNPANMKDMKIALKGDLKKPMTK